MNSFNMNMEASVPSISEQQTIHQVQQYSIYDSCFQQHGQSIGTPAALGASYQQPGPSYSGHIPWVQSTSVSAPICQEDQNVEDLNYSQWFDDTEMDSLIPIWESSNSLHINTLNATPETTHQSMNLESERSVYASPCSTHSSGEWSSGGESTMSQEDILEEIQRECAEIERRSLSPPSNSTKLKYRRSHRRQDLDSDDRKKQLNRIAATRYREKKRREKEELWVEEKELTDRNRQLNETVVDLKAEIGYLRKLLKDMEQRSRFA